MSNKDSGEAAAMYASEYHKALKREATLQAQVTEMKEQEEHGQECWEAQCEDLTQAEAQVVKLTDLLREAYEELNHAKLADTPLGADLAAALTPEGE